MGNERSNNFDFLRFFLAAMVLWSHSFWLLDGDGNRDPFVMASHGQIDTGALAVNFFLVISGYLITQSWMRSRGVGDFLKKRVLRIHPAFMVVVLFCAFVVGPLGAANVSTYFHKAQLSQRVLMAPTNLSFGVPDHLVFVRSPFPALNGSLWTIKYEFECYLALALLGVLGFCKKPGRMLLMFGLLMALYFWQQAILDPNVPIYHERGVRLFSYFFAGSCLSLYRERIPWIPTTFWVSAVVVVVVLFLLRSPLAATMALPIFGSYCLIYAAHSKSLPLQNFGKYGDFSYGMYLYGFPIQQLVIQQFGKSLNSYTLFLSVFPLVLGCAVLSWYCVEKPALNLKKRRSSRDTMVKAG